jgi:hypothetical protein
MTITHPATNLYESVISALGGPPETSYEPHLATINVGPEAPAAKLDGNAAAARLASIDAIAQMPSPSLVEARRALLLAAREEVSYGPAILTKLLRNDAITKAAALPDGALTELKDSVAKQQRDLQKYMVALIPAVQQVDGLFANTDQLKSAESATAYFAALDDLVATVGESLFAQWQTANLFWRVCCLARTHGAATVLDAARERATRWSASANGSHFARWLDQAVAQEGSLPKSSGIRVATTQRKSIKPSIKP